jgi:hypothetical protein
MFDIKGIFGRGAGSLGCTLLGTFVYGAILFYSDSKTFQFHQHVLTVESTSFVLCSAVYCVECVL